MLALRRRGRLYTVFFFVYNLGEKPDGEKDVLAKAVKSAGRTAGTASAKDAMTRRFVLFPTVYGLFPHLISDPLGEEVTFLYSKPTYVNASYSG